MTPLFQGTPVNIRINLILSESIESLGYIVVDDSIVYSTFIQIFVVGSERRVLKHSA